MDLISVLRDMDHDDDDIWTDDGLPRMEYIEAMMGDNSIKRKDVTDAAPHFSRGHADLPEENEVAFEKEEVDPEISEARAELRNAEADLRAAEEAVREAQLVLKNAQKIHDEAYNKVQRVDPPMTNAQAIRNFIDKSNEERMKRYVKRAAVLEALPGGSIDPRMPIDQAFERKRNRGGTRPKR